MRDLCIYFAGFARVLNEEQRLGEVAPRRVTGGEKEEIRIAAWAYFRGTPIMERTLLAWHLVRRLILLASGNEPFYSALMIRNLSLFLGVLLLGGCTVPNQARYQVASAGASTDAHPPATAADKEAVKEILKTVAGSLKLKDLTASSLVPNTIVYYQEIDSNNPVRLVAWTDGDKILVELLHWPETVGETLPYRSTREYIESELKRQFGDRSSTVAYRKLTAKPANSPQGDQPR
jgi:hypothetical protein